MPLWTDVIDAATLTGYARASLQAYEDRNGTLATYLPNQTRDDIQVRLEEGPNGLQEAAEFRAFDTEPSIAKQENGTGRILEFPAIGQKQPLSEYRRLRMRNAGDGEVQRHILKVTDQIVRAVSDRIEAVRGNLIDTGKVVVNQHNFRINDDFGRPDEHNTVAPVFWTDTTVSRIDYLLQLQEVFGNTNLGVLPGSTLMTSKVWAALRAGDEFINPNTGRPLSRAEINQMLAGEGLPPIRVYDRQIKLYGASAAKRTIRQNGLIMLPAEGTDDLGATLWGETLTASELDWGIADDERAGIVAGVVQSNNVPVITEVVCDAIGMPVMLNAALSLRAQVLPTAAA